jgi:hypothetical protein
MAPCSCEAKPWLDANTASPLTPRGSITLPPPSTQPSRAAIIDPIPLAQPR